MLVIVVSLAVNLTAQTIEQVISKRRKLMVDMCDQISIDSRHVATTAKSWQTLREVCGEAAVTGAEQLLNTVRQTIISKPADYYNDNDNLVDGATYVAGVASALESWGEGLQEVLDSYCAMNKCRASLAELLSIDTLDLTRRNLSPSAAYGLAALVYLSPTITDLLVPDNHFGDAGVAAIASAVGANPHSRLRELFLARTGAGERSGRALVQMVQSNTSILRMDLRGNGELDEEARRLLVHACESREGGALKLIF